MQAYSITSIYPYPCRLPKAAAGHRAAGGWCSTAGSLVQLHSGESHQNLSTYIHPAGAANHAQVLDFLLTEVNNIPAVLSCYRLCFQQPYTLFLCLSFRRRSLLSQAGLLLLLLDFHILELPVPVLLRGGI